ncbi:MAG TPA: DUF4438 domain-containing protein [Planctomycetota bacterium]|jgi:hypothetical protein|nr:DUF4438 domain-containing protein [Planctomycetota bacterium]
MIKTNLEKLIETAVCGEICHPYVWNYPDEKVGFDGAPFVPVGFSGINYSVKVGDPAFGWAFGEHVEPGAAVRNPDTRANTGLNMFSCVGNEAVVVEARMEGKDTKLKGAVGVVTGKHGGAERVLVYFPKRVLDRLCVGDRIQIRAVGVGLALPDYPDIRVMNCSPRLFRALNPSEKGGKVRVPVAKVIPGKLMGSGLGASTSFTGDYDIQSTSAEAVKEYSLDQLRLGDLVAISDHDCSHGPRWQTGAITIGIVVHGASRISGHGPGVNVLMTSSKGLLEPIITRKANLAELLALQ